MISCKTATQIIIKKELKQASFKEKVNLFVHLLICKACKLFKRQSQIIDSLIERKISIKRPMSQIKKKEIEEKLKEIE